MSTRRSFLQSALFLPSLLSVPAFAQDNKASAFADFENGTWGDWTVEGEAFGASPATDALFPGKIRGFGGNGFVCTLHPKKGNAATGKAVSREFTIEKPFITFKIGGGSFPGAACLNLVVDGQVTHTATGNGSATLSDASWDVSALVGKKARLEIVDNTASAERGYIMVDDIAFTDASPDVDLCGALQDALPAMLEEIRQRYHVPAMFVAVGYRNKIIALHCSGVRKLGYNSPVQVADKVMIGSISKSCVSIVVGNLVAEGIMRFDTKIAEALPDLREKMHPSYRDVTVSQLLKHTGGIAKDVGIPWDMKASAQKYRYTFAVNLLKVPPVAPIGQFSYSSGYEIVAIILERLTDQTYESLLSRYVLLPSGMKSAYMGRPYEDGSETGRLDQPWGHLEQKGKVIPFSIKSNTHIFCAAGGGMSCQIADLCRLGSAMFPGLQKRETPLGTKAYRLLCSELGWGGGFGSDGSACGDYSSIRISTNSLVVAVHSTVRLEQDPDKPNNELCSIIQNQSRLLERIG